MKLIFFILISITALGQTKLVTGPLTATDVNGASVQIDPRTAGGVVLFFTAARCPFDDYYINRMNDLQARFGRSFRFYWVNSSAEDSPAAMQAEIQDRSAAIPYLVDHTQSIRTSVAATKTTEVFVLKPSGNGFMVFYRGPVDDNAQLAADADNNFLKNALEAYTAGKAAVIPGARVAGCLIRDP